MVRGGWSGPQELPAPFFAVSPGRAAVRIEPWGAGDLALLEGLLGDPRMTEHLGGPEIPEKIAERHARYEQPGLGSLAADDATGEGLGWVGYWEREWQGEQIYEIGRSVLPTAQDAASPARRRSRCSPPRGRSGGSGSSTPTRRSTTCPRTRSAGSSVSPFSRTRVRVPAGPLHALQRLAVRPVRRGGLAKVLVVGA